MGFKVYDSVKKDLFYIFIFLRGYGFDYVFVLEVLVIFFLVINMIDLCRVVL